MTKPDGAGEQARASGRGTVAMRSLHCVAALAWLNLVLPVGADWYTGESMFWWEVIVGKVYWVRPVFGYGLVFCVFAVTALAFARIGPRARSLGGGMIGAFLLGLVTTSAAALSGSSAVGALMVGCLSLSVGARLGVAGVRGVGAWLLVGLGVLGLVVAYVSPREPLGSLAGSFSFAEDLPALVIATVRQWNLASLVVVLLALWCLVAVVALALSSAVAAGKVKGQLARLLAMVWTAYVPVLGGLFLVALQRGFRLADWLGAMQLLVFMWVGYWLCGVGVAAMATSARRDV